MSLFILLYHFLGSIRFTLILIASVAAFVIAGTLIESATESHRFAAHFTYGNPFFIALLWGFFINILFSATRRWPFQVRHIPFLVAHFGLLMVFGGTLAKAYFGRHGSMDIIEGSASHEIFEADTYVVQLDKREWPIPRRYELKRSFWQGFENKVAYSEDGPQLKLMAYHPHSSERLATWIKDDHGYINGLTPLPIHEVDDTETMTELPLSGRARFHESDAQPWDIYVLRTTNVGHLLESLYVQGAHIRLTERRTGALIGNAPLRKIMDGNLELSIESEFSEARIKQHLNFSDVLGFNKPQISVELVQKDGRQTHSVAISLDGSAALLNANLTTPYFGSSPVAVDISRNPCLALVEDAQKDVYLFVFDEYGKVGCQPFRSDNLQSLIVYDEGYGGYAVQAALSFPAHAPNRTEREEAMTNLLKDNLKRAIAEKTLLSPPLQLMQDACQRADADFPAILTDFLVHWDKTHSWLYPINEPLPPALAIVFDHFDWSHAEREERACLWTVRLFEQIEPQMQKGKDLMITLGERKWPLLFALEEIRSGQGDCTTEETGQLLTMLTRQIFSAAQEIEVEDDLPKNLRAEKHAQLFSAYLRAYAIHLSTAVAIPDGKADDNEIHLETDAVPVQLPLMPETKMEDNSPKITLYASQGARAQTISLSYDPYAKGLKWPILNGDYLIRFQPKVSEIPYRVRLRSARQINYAHSAQPFSYECDVIVTERATGRTSEKTISMNHVHETWDGYRFYLSNISPSAEGSVKHVQIIVNHDPAKYWLTYPGAFVLTCGIILLFWLRPYRNRQ